MVIHATVVAFDISVVLSVLLILGTLVTAMLSKSISRSPSWYNLMVAWLVYSSSYGLLIGRQGSSGEPPLVLCFTQTLLVYAVPVLATSALFSLYIELYLILSKMRSGGSNHPRPWRSFWLVITPWLGFIVIIIELLLLIFPGGRFHLVERAPTNFYCHLGDSLPSMITGVVLMTIVGVMLPLQVWLPLTIYRSSNTLRHFVEADRQLFIASYVRLTLTTLGTIVGFSFSIMAVFWTGPNKTSLAYPMVAVIMAVTFGTQKDILQVWLFRRPSRPSSLILFTVSRAHGTGSEEGFGQNASFVHGVPQTGVSDKSEALGLEAPV